MEFFWFECARMRFAMASIWAPLHFLIYPASRYSSMKWFQFLQTAGIFLNVLDMSRISYHLKGCRGGVCFHYSVASLSPSYMCRNLGGREMWWEKCVQQCVHENVCVCGCVGIKRCQPWRGHGGPGACSHWPTVPNLLCHIDSVSITTVEGTIKGCCGCVVY